MPRLHVRAQFPISPSRRRTSLRALGLSRSRSMSISFRHRSHSGSGMRTGSPLSPRSVAIRPLSASASSARPVPGRAFTAPATRMAGAADAVPGDPDPHRTEERPSPAVSGTAVGCPGEDIAAVPDHRHEGDGAMHAVMANHLRAMQGGEAGGGTRPLCRTPRRRPMRQVRRADLRRRIPLRALRHPRRPATGAQERRGQKTLHRPPGCRTLYRLRSLFAGRREVSGLRRTLLPPLRSLPRHPRLEPQLHRRRTRHGRVSRHLRQRGRGRRLPRLRETVPGPGRDRPGYQPDGPADRLDLNGYGGGAAPCRRPGLYPRSRRP